MAIRAGTGTQVETQRRHPVQYAAVAIAAVYTLIGVLGFFLTGFDGFASPEGPELLGFEINPLHNLVHLAVGLAGLALWRTLAGTRGFGWLLAVVFVPTFLYGLAVAGSEEQVNFLALNVPDNWLHLFTAIAGLAIALWPVRRT